MTIPAFKAASVRLYEKFSTSNVIAGSIKDIAEVMAAKNNKIKKSVPNTSPPGIAPKAIGSVWKINPGPADDGSRLYVKTIGKIITPANIATNVSAKATREVTSRMENSSDK